MPNEASLRRRDFRPGRAIRLADGQEWIFPGPRCSPPGALDFEAAADAATVTAVFEAFEPADRRRAELALAIRLLGHNYRLGPGDYRALLTYDRNDPALTATQNAFHELALEYARRLWPADVDEDANADVDAAGSSACVRGSATVAARSRLQGLGTGLRRWSARIFPQRLIDGGQAVHMG